MSENKKSTILIVDDEPLILDMLVDYFGDEYRCSRAGSGEEAIAVASRCSTIAAVILDIKMVPLDGIATASVLRQHLPHTPILLHTAHSEYDEAQIDATIEPFDFIRKGGSLPRLRRSVRNAVQAYLSRMNPALSSADARVLYQLVGRSPKMLSVYEQIRKAAANDVKVLIRGETGTGKELVAKAIYNHGARRDKHYVILQGHRRSTELVQSELFGHVRGAYTDAVRDQIGHFEYADGGTLFIDEVSELDLDTQAKLLRVIETGEYYRMGESVMRKTNIRLICATNKNLMNRVTTGEFREDFYYRIKELEIALPTLNERREDIPLLVDYFIDEYLRKKDLPPKRFEQAAMDTLLAHDWRGNVRHLESRVKAIVSTTESDLIMAADVRSVLEESPYEVTDEHDTSLASRMRDFKRACVVDALNRYQNNVRQTAKYLDVDPANLHRLIRELEIRRVPMETDD